MNFLGHAIGAGVAGIGMSGILLANGISTTTALQAGGILWLGGQVPDLDIGSVPARWFGRIGFLAAALLFGYGYLVHDYSEIAFRISSVIGIAALLLMSMKHRGPMHKYWLPAVLIFLGVFGVFRGEYLTQAFGIGWCVHLLLDRIFPW